MSLSTQKARLWNRYASDALRQFVERSRKGLQIPGVSLAIVQHEHIVYCEGFGFRSLDAAEPVTAETLFRIGSATKPITTLMMARLVENGSFSWSTPVQDLLPSFALADPDMSRRMEMWHTVSACTGLSSGDTGLFFRFKDVSPEQRLAELRTVRTTTPPGGCFEYSNRLVAVGGYAAARTFHPQGTLQEAFGTAITRLVLAPLRMANSTMASEDAQKRIFAKPHARTIDGECCLLDPVLETSAESVAPAGALWSTAPDLAQYLLLELRRGRDQNGLPLLRAMALQKRWHGRVVARDNMSYGLGLLCQEEQGLKVVGHGGNTFGFSTDLYFLPEQGLGVAVLVNLGKANTFMAAVKRKIFEITFGAQARAEEIVAGASQWLRSGPERWSSSVKTNAESLHWLQELVGEYENEELGPLRVMRVGDGYWVAFESWGSKLAVAEELTGGRVVLLTSPPWSGTVKLQVTSDRQALIFGTRFPYTFYKR